MSLIQEALRRKAKEAGEMPGELPPAYPVEPPPPPPRRVRAMRGKVRARAVGLLVLGLLGGAGTVLYYLREQRPVAPEALRAKTATTKAVMAVKRESGGQPIRPSGPGPGTLPEPAVPPEPPAPVASEALPAFGGTESAAEEPVSAAPSPTVEPEKASWPVLRLQGVMARGGAGQRSAAFINAEMVEEGEQIEGVVLVEVGAAGVWLEFGGEKKFLRVGQSLP